MVCWFAGLDPSSAQVSAIDARNPTAVEACSTARALVECTLDNMGVGRDLRRLHTLRFEIQSITFDLAQNNHADAPFPVSEFATASVLEDYLGDREVTIRSAEGGGETRLFLSRQAQVTQSPNGALGKAIPPPPSWESQDPVRALLLARLATDLVREADTVSHDALQRVVSFRNGRFRVRIFIDERLGLPTATESTVAFDNGASGSVAWNGRGDITDRAEFMVYDLVEGLRFPLQTHVFRDGVHLRSTVRSGLRLDAKVDIDAIATLPAVPAPQALDMDALALGQIIGPDPGRGTEEIAPGIIQIAGSWYSTIVRQPDGLVIIDAPISAGYSHRVLAEAARRFPDLPVKAVIASTGFAWHIGGLREYAARGIPIYVRDRNLAIVQTLLAAPHTLAPDAYSRSPMKADLRPLSAAVTIGTGANATKVMPVRFGEQPMLMSWIADARILHTAEMVQPLGPGGALLYPESLLEIVRSVDEAGVPVGGMSIIGMHMGPTPWARVGQTLAKFAGPALERTLGTVYLDQRGSCP